MWCWYGYEVPTEGTAQAKAWRWESLKDVQGIADDLGYWEYGV